MLMAVFCVCAPTRNAQEHKAVIQHYIDEYGDLPRNIDPAKNIVLFSEKIGV